MTSSANLALSRPVPRAPREDTLYARRIVLSAEVMASPSQTTGDGQYSDQDKILEQFTIMNDLVQ